MHSAITPTLRRLGNTRLMKKRGSMCKIQKLMGLLLYYTNSMYGNALTSLTYVSFVITDSSLFLT